MPIEAAELETIINVLGEDRYSLEIIERGRIIACGMGTRLATPVSPGASFCAN
jgi:hypothetical protein